MAKLNTFQVANVKSFALTLDGLQLIYTYHGKSVNASFDPQATIDMMKRLGMIEGYDTDANGEPVILFEKDEEDGHGNWQSTTGYSTWTDFVRTYHMKEYEAAILAELNEGNKAINQFPVMLAKIFGKSNIMVSRA